MANDGGGQVQERLMDVGAFVPANSKAAELMKPCEGAFDRPPRLAQSATGVAAMRNERMNPQPLERPAKVLGVVGLIRHERVGARARSAAFALHRRNVDDGGQRGHDVVRVGGRDRDRQGHAFRIGQQVMLASRATAIRRIRAAFSPPSGALTKLLSSSDRDQSIWLAPLSCASRYACTLRQTPCSIHSTSRLDAVLPEQPNSCGESSQETPVLSTNRMTLSAVRLSTVGRPPNGD